MAPFPIVAPARMVSALALVLAGFLAPVGMAVANRSAPAIEVAAALSAVLGWALAGAPGGTRMLARACLRSPLAKAGWAFASLAGASFAWTIDRHATAKALTQMAPVVLAGVALVALAPRVWTRDAARRWLWAGVFVASGLILIEAFWSPPLPLRRLIHARESFSDLKRSATPLAILVFPALAFLAPARGRGGRFGLREMAVATALIIAAAVAFVAAQSGSAMLGLCVGLGVYALALVSHRLAAAALGAATLLALAAAPLLAPMMANARADFALLERFHANHRLSIWRAFGERVADHPMLGHGFGASESVAAAARPNGEIDLTARLVINSIHPHSQPLQIWVELGALGAALAALVVILLTLRLMRDDPRSAPPRLAALAAAFATAIASFGAWQAWWAAILGLTAAFFAVERARDGRGG
jgi:O-antigen ligase